VFCESSVPKIDMENISESVMILSLVAAQEPVGEK
jgi:hypothetical protein